MALDITPGNRRGGPPGVAKADVSNMEAIHTHSERFKTYSYFTFQQKDKLDVGRALSLSVSV